MRSFRLNIYFSYYFLYLFIETMVYQGLSMKKTDLKSEGKIILKTHSILYESLKEIPTKRKLKYEEEIREGKRIGKPRFENPLYEWPIDLLTNLRDHLQTVWDFFERYSFWFDASLFPLISYESRRVSKKSIIFLLENDVWNTDEVYGDYLIEKTPNEVRISYFRRDKKIRPVTLPVLDDLEIKARICRDAITQIQTQFTFLWDKLESEIKVCMEEMFHREPQFTLSPQELHTQLKKTVALAKEFPEAALLSLGRLSEIWLLLCLRITNTPPYMDIIREAEKEGLIDKHQERFLRKVKKHYNNLKHKTYYKIDDNLVFSMVEDFSRMFLTDS